MPDIPTAPIADELDLLKKRAEVMGIKYQANIGIETLRQKIKEVMEPAADPVLAVEPEEGETAKQCRMRRYRESRQLVRVRITCMNSAKNSWPGEIFTISNSTVGTIRRFVPFEAEEGWHVERLILQMIKSRKYAHHYQVKVDGRKVNRTKIIPEFAVAEIPSLTQKELDELARRQAATGSVESVA